MVHVNGETKVLGIIGFPVSHSLSPVIHNAVISKLKLNYIYVPFEVKPENLKFAVRGLFSSGVVGLNVTLPHKVDVLNFVDEIDESAKFAGSANTLILEGNRIKAYNTDAEGFLMSLREKGVEVEGKRALIFGAGGAGRAIVYALVKGGAFEITLVNRDLKKAEEVAKNFSKVRVEEFDLNKIEEKHISEHDIIINATSMGMKGKNPLLINFKNVKKNAVVCDIVYTPLKTEFLKNAEKRGLKIVSGDGMLLYQGALSFRLWTGIAPPLNLMRSALSRALKELNK